MKNAKQHGLVNGSTRIIFITDDPRFTPKVVIKYQSGTRRLTVKAARIEYARLLSIGYQKAGICECCEQASADARTRSFGDHDHPTLCECCYSAAMQEVAEKAERAAGWDATP